MHMYLHIPETFLFVLILAISAGNEILIVFVILKIPLFYILFLKYVCCAKNPKLAFF